jgi:hypothetical protein
MMSAEKMNEEQMGRVPGTPYSITGPEFGMASMEPEFVMVSPEPPHNGDTWSSP